MAKNKTSRFGVDDGILFGDIEQKESVPQAAEPETPVLPVAKPRKRSSVTAAEVLAKKPSSDEDPVKKNHVVGQLVNENVSINNLSDASAQMLRPKNKRRNTKKIRSVYLDEEVIEALKPLEAEYSFSSLVNFMVHQYMKEHGIIK